MSFGQSNLPTVDFNDTDTDRFGSKPKLREGWYHFAVQQEFKKVDEKTGRLGISLLCGVMDSNEMPTEGAAFFNLPIPLCNPDYPKYIPFQWTESFFKQFLQGVNPEEFGPDPKRDSDGNWTYMGETYTPLEYDALRKKINKAYLAEAKKFWNGTGELLDVLFYGKIKHNGDFVNIEKVSTTLPGDAVLVDTDDMFVGR